MLVAVSADGVVMLASFGRSTPKESLQSVFGMKDDPAAPFDSLAMAATVDGAVAVSDRDGGVRAWRGDMHAAVAFKLPGLPVDTHVLRLSRRLGLTTEEDPVKVELELNEMVPALERGEFSLRIILHGRRVCDAKKPRCHECVLNDFCPSKQ